MTREWTALFSGISTSRKIASLADDTSRTLFYMLLPQCDAWGRIGADPAQLGAKVWPMLGKTEKQTQKALDDCARVGLIFLGECSAGPFLEIAGWDTKAGRVGRLIRDRGASEFPAVPRSTPVHPGLPRSTPARVEESREEENRVEDLRVPRAPRTDDQGLVLQHFEASYLEAYGKQYPFAGAKDGAQLKRLFEVCANGSVGDARDHIDRAFADGWRVERGIDLSSIVANYGKLVRPVNAPSLYNGKPDPLAEAIRRSGGIQA